MVPTVVLCIQIRYEEIQTPLQNVSIYLKPGSAWCWWKKKSNITHARRSTANESQQSRSHNEEWLVGVLLSWINIRGQDEPVNTQLLTFIEMHWMVVNTNRSYSILAEIFVCHWKPPQSARNKQPLFRLTLCLNAPNISFMFYACTCLI